MAGCVPRFHMQTRLPAKGLGTSTGQDAKSFTPARAATAIRAGVAAILTAHTGIVIQLP
ncbi:hypothetical protein JOF29_006037 [Kribbella aluminosa]|uniref:Uncharacterized protein n=1 Tax=Kribbella aluminosa TaxID=416017 RepID=A0ABS4UTF1_9ACTN|nr:hypothetical protein [Kribbella aluminosa]